MLICMRTTLDIDDVVLRAARRRAADEGKSLTSLLEDALRSYLDFLTRPVKPFKLRLRTVKGRIQPGVQLDDRDALYERMDGRG
jgi:hypothetical protein